MLPHRTFATRKFCPNSNYLDHIFLNITQQFIKFLVAKVLGGKILRWQLSGYPYVYMV